jgi:hypothetical protein
MTLHLLAALWMAWVTIGVASESRARRRLKAIPHRILVSGGRGKTTLVRLIHSGLLASSCAAIGRVSGDRPLFITPDGAEHRERRWGPANIRELRRVFRRMPRSAVDAAVVENMAIDPELQWVVAHRIVRPTIALMAPDALDHLEVLPAGEEPRARLLLSALPIGTELLLPDGDAHAAYRRCASQLGRSWASAPPCEETGLRPHMKVLAGMALETVDRVCGGAAASARGAVLATAKELQTVKVYRRQGAAWVDGFSANDPLAASGLAEIASREAERRGFSFGARLFNHRADRPSRLPLFCDLLDHGGPVWRVGAPFPTRWKTELRAPRLTGSPAEIVATIERVLAEKPGPAYVLCLGNTAGMGRALRQWLAAHAEAESW